MSVLPVLAVDGRTITQRPVREDDLGRLERMFHRTSPLTLYRRFFQPVPRIRPSVLRHLVGVDHESREAIVALWGDEIVGIAHYERSGVDPAEAEVAVMVEDAWHHQGVARFLLDRLAREARRNGIDRFRASVLADNYPALRLARTLNPFATMVGTGPERVLVMPLRRPLYGAAGGRE